MSTGAAGAVPSGCLLALPAVLPELSLPGETRGAARWVLRVLRVLPDAVAVAVALVLAAVAGRGARFVRGLFLVRAAARLGQGVRLRALGGDRP
ncbi:hypothetical protein AB0953_05290 [Streptomyces sp. NPDC046866]|uniref:hypothetical protein n=1 Tax=Streptomyces sp. NPDC046866 TaxID=3154921 RepID=UPI0034551490